MIKKESAIIRARKRNDKIRRDGRSCPDVRRIL